MYDPPWGTEDEDPTNLCDGFYSVTVTDDNGCDFISNPIFVAPALPTIGSFSVENVSCNGANDGQITINIVGGDPNYPNDQGFLKRGGLNNLKECSDNLAKRRHEKGHACSSDNLPENPPDNQR